MDAIWSSAVGGNSNLYHLYEIAFIVFMIGSYYSLMFLFKFIATWLPSSICSTAFEVVILFFLLEFRCILGQGIRGLAVRRGNVQGIIFNEYEQALLPRWCRTSLDSSIQ